MTSKPLVHKETTNWKAQITLLKLCSLTSHTSQPFESNPSEDSEFYSDLYSTVTGKESVSTVLLPFSSELTVDTEVKLSHDVFK